uniref:LRRNT domain-containing protein n=1 Tax=Ciona savignyi TaxID=51511 RepID=H2YQE9_CIOSA
MCKKLGLLIFSIILYARCHCQLPGEQALPTLFLGPSNTCPSECVAAVRPCDCYTDGFIDCARKQLVNIPSTLPNCAKLINLQHNNITNISVFDFQSIRNADDLKLSFNKITQLPAGAFTHMPNLTKLYITNNLITNIEECTFQGLKSLEFLYMENNLISSIASEAFIGLFKLNTLSLMGNRLSTFNPK